MGLAIYLAIVIVQPEKF
ncbi:potassium-transporting ATPase subunit F [Arthrospira platensis PCC 7345]